MKPPFHGLDDWLTYISRQHPKEIDLGLERVRQVYDQLELGESLPPAVVVAGTNGKGSTIAAMESGLAAMGARVGVYTSPHIQRFNERVRLCGHEVSDQSLLDAFELVEKARGDVALTYFEFTTIAAFVVFSNWSFEQEGLDIILCEVGLGGRLDAVNVLDAELAIVTSIGLDHQDWLGSDLRNIAREKAGVFRKGCIGLVGETFPAPVLSDLVAEGFDLYRIGEDFGQQIEADLYTFRYQGESVQVDPVGTSVLPKNNLVLAMQGCLVVFASELIPRISIDEKSLLVSAQTVASAIRAVTVAGRLERFQEEPETILDVGHNEQAVSFLSEHLANNYNDKPVFAVFSCLMDKDLNAILDAMVPNIEKWFIAELNCDRARQLPQITDAFEVRSLRYEVCSSIAEAMSSARHEALSAGGIVLAFGSFYVIEEIKKARGEA